MWGNDAVAVYVKTDDWPDDYECPFTGRTQPGLEALMWPEAIHPSGKTNLVRVSYIYLRFNGWVRKDRIHPRY